MRFEGQYSGILNGRLTHPQPIFRPDEKIFVFDLEEVLVLQRPIYTKGLRCGPDGYRVHGQAGEVVARALRDFDKVVIWSTSPKVFDVLQCHPFNEVHQRIAGAVFIGEESLVKNLGVLTVNYGNVAAIEDDERFFEPLSRVVELRKGDSLLDKYYEARDLVIN